MTEADEARVLAVSAPVLIPLIRKRADQTLSKLIGAYRNSEPDLRSIVAEYAAHMSLLTEIERILNNYNRGE